MDLKSNRSNVSKKSKAAKPIFDSMVNEFSTNAYTSKGLNLALNVKKHTHYIDCALIIVHVCSLILSNHLKIAFTVTITSPDPKSKSQLPKEAKITHQEMNLKWEISSQKTKTKWSYS